MLALPSASRLFSRLLSRSRPSAPANPPSEHPPWSEAWVDETYTRAIGKMRHIVAEYAASSPEGSARRHDLQNMAALPDDAFAEAFNARIHANPDRVGCPSREVLVELGTGVRELDDRAWAHVSECHPCTVEVRTIRAVLRPVPD